MTDLDLWLNTEDALEAILKAMIDESSPVRGTVYLQFILIILKIATFASPLLSIINHDWIGLLPSALSNSGAIAAD